MVEGRCTKAPYFLSLLLFQSFVPYDFESSCHPLSQFPNLGRPRDEILPALRSLSMESYLILYTATEFRVDILRVVSGYRDLTSLFTDDDE